MFAVVEIAGKQYKVQKSDIFDVDHIDVSAGESVNFDKVLMISGGEATNVGTPYVQKASVTAKVLEQYKGEKIAVRRYKSKVRYRKSMGFRPSLTKLQILNISEK